MGMEFHSHSHPIPMGWEFPWQPWSKRSIRVVVRKTRCATALVVHKIGASTGTSEAVSREAVSRDTSVKQ